MYASAAGNYTDTYYFENYNGSDDEFSTGSRAKRDYTSSYLKNLHRNKALLTNVCATSREDRKEFLVLENCSAHYYYAVNAGEAKYLPNYVKERGYNYCTIMLTPIFSGREAYDGYWSPDSI